MCVCVMANNIIHHTARLVRDAKAMEAIMSCSSNEETLIYLVDPASSHMLVSKTKPCMCKYKRLNRETANGSLNQL